MPTQLAAIAALALTLLRMPVALGEEHVVVFQGNFSCSTWLPYWSMSMGSVAGELTVQVRSHDRPPIRASYAAIANEEQASLHYLSPYFCGASKAQLTVGGPTLVSKTVKIGLLEPGTDCRCSSSSCTTYAYVHCGAAVGCNPATELYCFDQRGTGRFEVTITKKSDKVMTTVGVPPPTTTPLPVQVQTTVSYTETNPESLPYDPSLPRPPPPASNGPSSRLYFQLILGMVIIAIASFSLDG